MKRLIAGQPARLAPILILLASLALSGVAWAQAPGADKDNPASMGFEATDEPIKENLPGWPFLYGAYSFIWAILMGYVVFLWMRQRQLNEQIARIDRRLGEVDHKLDMLDEAKG